VNVLLEKLAFLQKFNVSARIDRRTKHSGMKLERDRVA
jgi:hypothetical protein